MARPVDRDATVIEMSQLVESNAEASQTQSDSGVSSLISAGSLSNDEHVTSLPSPECSQNSSSSHDASPSSGSHLRMSGSVCIKMCPCVAEPEDCEVEACQPPLNKKCSEDCIRLCIFEQPDYVKWYAPPETVTIKKDETGKLGFRFKEVQSERARGEKYTLVLGIKPGGPADGELSMGDCILSANGIALQEKKFLEVLHQNEDKQLRMIKCRPMGLLPLTGNQKQLRPPYHRSQSAPSPRRQSEKSIKRQLSCKSCGNEHTRQDYAQQLKGQSSDTSLDSACSHNSLFEKRSNSSLSSNHPTSYTMTSVDERDNVLHKYLPTVEAEMTRILASNMPRLPRLKIIIIGCQSNTLAESLLPRKVPPVSRNEVYTKYNTCLIKNDKECEWLSIDKQQETTQPIVKAVTKALRKSLGDIDFRSTRVSQSNSLYSKLLQQICQNATGPTNMENFEEVELEIIAMDENPIGSYCRHVLYNAHCIYIIQIDHNHFLEDEKAALTYIQTQLSEIRSYASDKVQVILVVTSTNKLTPKKMDVMGQSLEEHFSSAFGNQLLYHPATDLPCYFVFPCNHTIATNQKPNNVCSGDMHGQVRCEDSTISQTRPNVDDSVEDIKQSRDGKNLQHVHCGIRSDVHWEVDVLKTQINSLVFQQQFVSKKYPYQYLIHRGRREEMSLDQLIGVQKSDIMRECGVNKQADETALLEFLHDCGDIICMDYLQFMVSQHLLNSRLSFMVLLNRDHLIDAVQKFIPIPSCSVQDQEYRSKWADLQAHAEISHHFLLQLLGSDAEVLCIFLDMMNLIYCLDGATSHLDEYNKVPRYLVPFYLNQTQKQQESTILQNPQYLERILYIDFAGFIPHGMFMSFIIQLSGLSNETNGTWEKDCGCVTSASDFKLQLEVDQLAAAIKISAECKTGYHPRNIYDLLCECMKRLRPRKGVIRFKCGPTCPSCQCKRNAKIHVLDINDGRVSMWCGKTRVDQEASVKQWLVEEPRKNILYSETAKPVYIQLSNNIRDLPWSLYKLICDRLSNKPYSSGYGWEMLADKLGYTTEYVQILRLRHQTAGEDPCDTLLQDWGRSSTATLETLMQLLHKMGRHDLLTDMQEGWCLTK